MMRQGVYTDTGDKEAGAAVEIPSQRKLYAVTACRYFSDIQPQHGLAKAGEDCLCMYVQYTDDSLNRTSSHTSA